MFATGNVRKIITCAWLWRQAFARTMGRTNNKAAPVVRATLARTAVTSRSSESSVERQDI